jgi:hypothetical protein
MRPARWSSSATGNTAPSAPASWTRSSRCAPGSATLTSTPRLPPPCGGASATGSSYRRAKALRLARGGCAGDGSPVGRAPGLWLNPMEPFRDAVRGRVRRGAGRTGAARPPAAALTPQSHLPSLGADLEERAAHQERNRVARLRRRRAAANSISAGATRSAGRALVIEY